jgi:transposase InsO family protein
MGRKKSGRRGEAGGGSAAGREGREGLKPKRQYTPEERRRAVEAYRSSGLTQGVFARQWGISHVTLGLWARRYEKEGPRGLERLAKGPPRRRGKAPLAEPVKAEIVAVQRRFPTFGLKKVRDWLWRFVGLKVSAGSVRKVVVAAGLPRAPAPRKRRTLPPPRRFERARPGELWQTDITYLPVPWHKGPLYLIAFLDDFSRYVVGWGLFTHQRQGIALEVLEGAIVRFGRPKEVLSDQGRQFFAWRGKSAFQKLLAREGISHVVARAHHPQTLGKVERLWETVKRELWDRVHPRDLEEARERLKHYFAHYNHFRPHQSLEGQVPADRFFGVREEVRRAIEEGIEKNALRIALGEAPRKPVFLVGQIDGTSVSVHGEQGRVVVQTSQGLRQEFETKDLGINPERTVQDESDEQGDDDESDDDDDPDGDEGVSPGAEPGPGGPPAPPRPQAAAVPGAPDAGAGAGAVGGGERGGAPAGAPGGGAGARDLAGAGEP